MQFYKIFSFKDSCFENIIKLFLDLMIIKIFEYSNRYNYFSLIIHSYKNKSYE